MDAIIVLSGLPAACKSTLRKHLVEGFGMAGCSLNWEDNDPRGDLWQTYARACTTGDPNSLAQMMRRLFNEQPVVIEWGPPANDQAAPVCFPSRKRCERAANSVLSGSSSRRILLEPDTS
jgi:hypothetical protein